MRFFKTSHLRYIGLSLIVGAIGLFFIKDALRAAGRAGVMQTSTTQPAQPRQVTSPIIGQQASGDQITGKNSPSILAAQREKERLATIERRKSYDAGGKKKFSPELKAAMEEQVELARAGDQVAQKAEKEDLYTQSEAHMQLDDVKQKMKDFLLYAEGTIFQKDDVIVEKTPNEIVAPYLNIIAAALKKEEELKKTHYVFYHGMTSEWRVPQDIYKQLYAYFNPLKTVKDFVFVRFSDMPFVNAKDYLSEHVTKFAGVNDNKDKTILPVNLALFGNVGFPGECTWNYFIMNKSHKWPFPENYVPILESFNLSYDSELLAKEAGELCDMLANATEEQALLQIFIPKEKVDDIGFLAWIIGFPAHPKSMELVEKMIGDKPMVGQITGPAVKKLMKQFKKKGEDDPIYKELLEGVENGDFGIDAFLRVYRNTPWKLQNPNDTQARLMITNDGLLNPDSGIKFFVYVTTPQDIQKRYLEGLDVLVKKIIDQGQNKK